MGVVTTIQLNKTTKKNLEGFREYNRETFDDIVNRLIAIGKKTRKETITNRLSLALLSEKALAKEWLSKREEKAWKDL